MRNNDIGVRDLGFTLEYYHTGTLSEDLVRSWDAIVCSSVKDVSGPSSIVSNRRRRSHVLELALALRYNAAEIFKPEDFSFSLTLQEQKYPCLSCSGNPEWVAVEDAYNIVPRLRSTLQGSVLSSRMHFRLKKLSVEKANRKEGQGSVYRLYLKCRLPGNGRLTLLSESFESLLLPLSSRVMARKKRAVGGSSYAEPEKKQARSGDQDTVCSSSEEDEMFEESSAVNTFETLRESLLEQTANYSPSSKANLVLRPKPQHAVPEMSFVKQYFSAI